MSVLNIGMALAAEPYSKFLGRITLWLPKYIP